MIVEQLVVGELATNCYLIGCRDTHAALVIDPGGDGAVIVERIKTLRLNVKKIILTHGHVDHWAAAGEVARVTGAPVLIHHADAFMLTDPAASLALYMGTRTPVEATSFLGDGDTVEAGKVKLEVLHTPGHTPGGVCLYTAGIVFTGDTLFEGSIGRTDLPGGDMRKLVSSIKKRLLVLPDDTEVCPGHGPRTTIGDERRYNPFLTGEW